MVMFLAGMGLIVFGCSLAYWMFQSFQGVVSKGEAFRQSLLTAVLSVVITWVGGWLLGKV